MPNAQWPIDRLIVAGYNTPHLQRHVGHALAAGVEVLQVGRRPFHPGPPPARFTFVPFSDADSPEVNKMKFHTEVYQRAVAAEAARLRIAAADFRPDLVHVVGMDFSADVCREAGVAPLVVSALGYLEYLDYDESVGTGPRDQVLLADAAALIVEPPTLVERCRTAFSACPPIYELSAGLNAQHFRPADAGERVAWRRSLHLPPEATVILSPRGWQPTYRHHQVLAAFAEALPNLPQPATLVFVQMGRDAVGQRVLDYYAAVQAQAQTLGIADRMRWLPAFPAVAMTMLYAVADVVVSYRTPDTFPVTVLEALACCRPVIAPRLPTFRDSVIERYATLVEPNQPAALAAAMVAAVMHPPASSQMAAARAAVIAKYDAPVVSDKIAAIYAAAHENGASVHAH